jgi:hypothetical protein
MKLAILSVFIPKSCSVRKLRNTPMSKPRILLQIEGAAVLLTACVCYHQSHGGWLWFALLLLTPDLSMLGYLINEKLGATVYNIVHTYTFPLCLFLLLWLVGQNSLSWLLFIWLAHIGMDRMLGFGLKYETAFKDTHLQRV